MCNERSNCTKCGKDMDKHRTSHRPNGKEFCDKKRIRKYCSVECAGKGRLNDVECKQCKCKFRPNSSKHELCSNVCSGIYRNNTSSKPVYSKGVEITNRDCKSCNNKVYKNCSYCNDCTKSRITSRRRKTEEKGKIIKRVLVHYKGSRCIKCGYCKHDRAMNFHHIDGATKLFTVESHNARNKSWNQLLNEVDKCELLCSNCHAEHHNTERDNNTKSSYVANKERYTKRKLEAIKKLGGKCSKCDYKFTINNIQVATFHHLEIKLFPLDCKAFLQRNESEIEKELSKCEILCFNCHMEEH